MRSVAVASEHFSYRTGSNSFVARANVFPYMV